MRAVVVLGMVTACRWSRTTKMIEIARTRTVELMLVIDWRVVFFSAASSRMVNWSQSGGTHPSAFSTTTDTRMCDSESPPLSTNEMEVSGANDGMILAHPST